MTSADDVDNLILGSGSSAVTIYVTKMEEIFDKSLTPIKGVQSSANYGAGPKKTRFIDLLMITKSYSVDGEIDLADKGKLKALLTAGGIFNVDWENETFEDGSPLTGNISKLSITKDNSREDAHRQVKMLIVLGTNITG